MKVSLLTSRYVHIKTWGSIFNISVRSALLYGQCWAITRLICGVKHSHRLSVDPLYNRLGIEPLSTLLRLRCFSWFGHVSLNEGWIRHCFCLDVVGLPAKNMRGSHWGWLKILENKQKILWARSSGEVLWKVLPKHSTLVSWKEDLKPDK